MESIGLLGMLQVAGTTMATLGAISASSAAAQQDANNAAIADANAKQVAFESQVASQESDFEARQELGALIASGGASGLNLGSGSVFLQRRSKEELAAKDRARIAHAGDIERTQLEQQGDDFRSSSNARSRTTFFSAVSGGLNIGDSYVSASNRVSRRTNQTITGGDGI